MDAKTILIMSFLIITAPITLNASDITYNGITYIRYYFLNFTNNGE
jgi:hypothetical protein